MEVWGTLSTHDHRSALLKNSLLFFDRLVIPVPSAPIYDIESQELDEIVASVEFLKEHDAAVSYNWDSYDFENWKIDAIQEGMAVGQGDSLHDSRMMLVDTVDTLAASRNISATGMPVYSSTSSYRDRTEQINKIKESLLVGVSSLINVPNESCALEDIINLREKDSFQSALTRYREWQNQVIPQLLLTGETQGVESALTEFRQLAENYNRVVEDHLNARRKNGFLSLLALGGAALAAFKSPELAPFIGATAPAAFSLVDLREPAWRLPQDGRYAPAAIIYEANSYLK